MQKLEIKNHKKIILIVDELINHLELGKSVRTLTLEKDSHEIIDPLNLITIKPVIYLCNVDEDSVLEGNNYVQDVKHFFK